MPKKKPFSGSQKAAQMKARRQAKRAGAKPSFKDGWDFGGEGEGAAEDDCAGESAVVFTAGGGGSGGGGAAARMCDGVEE